MTSDPAISHQPVLPVMCNKQASVGASAPPGRRPLANPPANIKGSLDAPGHLDTKAEASVPRIGSLRRARRPATALCRGVSPYERPSI